MSEQTFHEFAERYTGSRAGSAAIGMRVRFRHADTIFEDERTTEQTADRQQGHGEQLQQQPIHCPFALTCFCQILVGEPSGSCRSMRRRPRATSNSRF